MLPPGIPKNVALAIHDLACEAGGISCASAFVPATQAIHDFYRTRRRNFFV